MTVIRYKTKATSTNLDTIVGILNDPNCRGVRLFATKTPSDDTFTESDGNASNGPLVSAIATYTIPGIGDVNVLFDGLFLTAARRPRFEEVQALMDAAQASGRATFATIPVPFTSSRDAEAAVTLLLDVPAASFSQTTRAHYFSLLSSIPEATYP